MSKFLLCLLTLHVASAANLCEAPADVRDALKRPGESSSLGKDRTEFTRSVLTKFPDDLWAHRAYQDSFRQGLVYRQTLIDEYQAALAKHPADPEYLYLYGRVLTGTTTPAAIRTLDQAIAKDPGYAPARLALVEIYRAPNFKDAEKAKANLKVWMSACPNQFDGFHFLERMDDAPFVRVNAARLRTLLAARTDDSAIGHYRMLWTLEFQSTPAPEFPRLREAIRADLAKLRGLETSGQSTSPLILRTTLREGYKLAGDTEGTKWVESKYPSASGDSSGLSGSFQAYRDWEAAHPYPKTAPGATLDQSVYDARNKEFLDVTAEWVTKWPNDYYAWSQRVTALQQNRETPDTEVERAAEGLKKSAQGTPADFRIASLYMQRNMHLEEIPEIVKRGLANLDRTPVPQLTSDLYPASTGARNGQVMSRLGGYGTLSDAYLRLSRTQDALDALAEMRKQLDEYKPDAKASDIDKRMWGQEDSTYWNKMGMLAERQGHKLDALTYYQNQIRSSSVAPDKNYIARQAKTLWSNLGGTSAGWDAWLANVERITPATVSVATSHSEWTDKDTSLPPFQLADVSGMTWQLNNLQGKVTLVNLWATWCGPCKQELPLLQKLYDKVKDRTDVQVITFNTDENPGVIDQFMKENKYTFPVLPARAYVDTLVPSLSIPRNWIVNKEGVLKRESIGFGVSSNRDWVDHMLDTMVKTN